MKLITTLEKRITDALRIENERKSAEHISSGKLSASWLGYPTQWQVLKTIGVPQKPVDDYALRLFLRGNHVEDWVVSHLNPVEKQKPVSYRNVVGIVDALVDTAEWDFPNGVLPFEVKSVKNSKYKWILDRKSPDRSHLLQASLYALALGTTEFGIIYVAADDYRTHTTVHAVADYKVEIDAIIDRFDEAMSKKEIPAFALQTEDDSWMINPKYAKFDEAFINLSGEPALAKARTCGKIIW